MPEYIDSGTVSLALTPSATEQFLVAVLPQSALLDDFNRADDSTPPPGSSWATRSGASASDGLVIVSNQAARRSAGGYRQGNYWNQQFTSGYPELWMDFSEIPSTYTGTPGFSYQIWYDNPGTGGVTAGNGWALEIVWSSSAPTINVSPVGSTAGAWIYSGVANAILVGDILAMRFDGARLYVTRYRDNVATVLIDRAYNALPDDRGGLDFGTPFNIANKGKPFWFLLEGLGNQLTKVTNFGGGAIFDPVRLTLTPSAQFTISTGTVQLTLTPSGVGSTATTTVPVAASNDDGQVERGAAYNDWDVGTVTTYLPGGTFLPRKVRNQTSGFSEIITGHMLFDTSVLPDNATITKAVLKIMVGSKATAEARSLDFEWYDHGAAIDSADYSANIGTSAASVPAATWQAWAVDSIREITLSNPTNVNILGKTGIRVGISGGQPPPGNNDTHISIYAWDHATNPAPELVITYDVGPYEDTGTPRLTLTPSSIAVDYPDAATVSLKLSPSIVEEPQRTAADRTFSPAFSTDAGQMGFVEVGSDGKTLHYLSNIGSNNLNYRRSFDEGGTWSAPVNIANSKDNVLERPIAVKGDFVYVIYERDAALYYKRSTDGGATFGSEVTMNTGVTNQFYRGAIVPGPGNVVHLAYARINNASITPIWQGQMYYRRSTDNGATWSAEVQPYPNGAEFSSASRPNMAVSGNIVFLTWSGLRTGDAMLQDEEINSGRSLDGGLTWEPRVNHVLSDSIYAHRPDIAISGDGMKVLVMWQEGKIGSPGSELDLYYRRSADSGVTWGTTVRLTNAPNASEHAYLASRGDRLAIAWADYRSGSGKPYAAFSENFGDTWSAEQNFSSLGTGSPGAAISYNYFHVTVNPTGDIRYLRAPWVLRNSRRFNAVGDGIVLANEADFDFERTTPFTVLAWIRDRQTGASSTPFVRKTDDANNSMGWRFDRKENGFRANLRKEFGNQITIETTNALSANTWHQMGYTFNGNSAASGVLMYANGVSVAKTVNFDTLTSSILHDVQPKMGWLDTAAAQDFDMAYAAVWNVELTAAEVAAYYAGPTIPRQDALVGFYRLDGAAIAAKDETGGNDGTITGTVLGGGPPIVYDPLITTVRLTLTPSGVDEYNLAGSVFTDAATVSLSLTPSAIEEREQFDEATVLVALTPSSTDVVEYVDAATADLILTPSSVIEGAYTDQEEVGLVYTLTATEFREISDEATVYTTFTPSSADVVEYVEADTVALQLRPEGVDDWSGEGYIILKLTPAAFREIYLQTSLAGIMYTRYAPGQMYTRYDGTIPFSRWWTNWRGSG